MAESTVKWDARFIELTRLVAKWSKDPSTQCGCAIVRSDRTIASVGYNGFPRGVADMPQRLKDRSLKYAYVVHAEANAIVAAKEPLNGFTAYVWPFPPCTSCAGLIIQAGIKRVITCKATRAQRERWGESWDHALTMFLEAGVNLQAAFEQELQ